MNNNLINEILKEIIENSKVIDEGRAARGARGRVLRLPNIFASEISVGQKPDSEERAIFQTWMSKIQGTDPQAKIQSVQDFIKNPAENLSIADTLSYLMFLNVFSYVITEFNPSVAGFLWEPLLAGLFGRTENAEGKTVDQVGQQIPAGAEHDIADIRIYEGDEVLPYSLKVLSRGDVKGSFVDLTNHFIGEEDMTYIVVHKSSKTKMNFHQFILNSETIFDWIGHMVYVPTPELRPVTSKLSKFAKVEGKKLVVRFAGHRGAKQALEIATLNKEGKWQVSTASGGAKSNVDSVQKMGLKHGGPEGPPVVKGDELDLNAAYTATLPVVKAGGTGGWNIPTEWKPTEKRSANSVALWGDDEQYQKWAELFKTVDRKTFWEAVAQGTDFAPEGAPGIAGREQFHVSESHWLNKAPVMASISVSEASIRKVYKAAAARIGEDITLIFNSLADLTDNVGRFFLSNCGGAEVVQKCNKRDFTKRGKAGKEAVKNATELEDAVARTVKEELPAEAIAEQKQPGINLNKLIEQMIEESSN